MATELSSFTSEYTETVSKNRFFLNKSRLLKSMNVPQNEYLGQYKLGKIIGSGRCCEVRQAFLGNDKYAIKIFPEDQMTPPRIAQIEFEIKTLQKLDHPNVVKILHIVSDNGKIGFVMNEAENGDLFHYIANYGPLPERLARRITWQLCSTLQYLHTHCVVHRDIKPENLLLDKDMNLIITDFEFCFDFSRNGFAIAENVTGTPTYCPPEAILSKTPCDALKGDVWAMGVTLYTACCGYLPFNDFEFSNNTPQEIARLYVHILKEDPQFPPFLTNDAQDLINRMLCKTVSRRLTVKDVLNHRWFALPDFDLTNDLSFSSSSSESSEVISIEDDDLTHSNVYTKQFKL